MKRNAQTNSNISKDAKVKRKPYKKGEYPFGNYPDYYGYRNRGCSSDPRISVMKNEWFENKRCLDIGCNTGVFTLDIAKHFNMASLLGIDLDKKLIQQAKLNLRFEQEELSSPSYNGSFKDLNSIVSFRGEDYCKSAINNETYDVILCLSVAKWIHINYGDDGIKLLFEKVSKQLTHGGLFIFEPQQWSSYQKAKFPKESKKIIQQLKILPSDFQALIEAQGLELISTVKPKTSNFGFGERDLYIFMKKSLHTTNTDTNTETTTNTNTNSENTTKM